MDNCINSQNVSQRYSLWTEQVDKFVSQHSRNLIDQNADKMGFPNVSKHLFRNIRKTGCLQTVSKYKLLKCRQLYFAEIPVIIIPDVLTIIVPKC